MPTTDQVTVPLILDLVERQITATDAQINRLVFDLYGLTEDEIKIVEGRTMISDDMIHGCFDAENSGSSVSSMRIVPPMGATWRTTSVGVAVWLED
jgi:hypothetical protein